MPVYQDQLQMNEGLAADQALTSANGQFTFVYQSDGNLVLYKNYRNQPRNALWASNTPGASAGSCNMQGDGNLVVYDAGGNAVWASNTDGNPGSRLILQDDGNVVIYGPAGNPLWDTGTWGQVFAPNGPVAVGDRMLPGEVLNPGQSICSADGRFDLIYQGDGNLVLYRVRDWAPLWASNTAGQPAEVCIMQGDGNLVLYDGDAKPLWASNTAGSAGSWLIVQDDGNVVIYRPDYTPVWATNTVQPAPPSTINWPWAIILCQFNDIPTVPQPVDYYEDLFTRNGTGGVCDYWRTVSSNRLDLTGSKVFGWFTMSHSSAEVSQLRFPGDRSTLVQWGIDTATANGVNLGQFKAVLIVQNYGVDHGAAGNGILIVHQNATLCEFGFICHEMGHGFGLPHSLSPNPDMVYGDGWDLMSFATTTFQFPISFRGAQGAATVGLNARNLEALGVIPAGRTWTQTRPDFSQRIILDPVNQPPIGNHGYLVAKIVPSAARPRRSNNSSYTIEFRRKAGWDRNIPEDAVVVHEVRANGWSYLQPSIWGRFTAGQEFVSPDPKIYMRVESIDQTLGTAALRIWDICEGGLRKEDSKPNIYLIENGTKRWVTSPQALSALGKAWSDVRVVPDGALNGLPAGPDIL
jgi:hypothetical protein